MATQLSGGADLLDVIGGGFISRGVEETMSRTSEMVRASLPKAGQDFIDRWRDTYQTLDMNSALNLLERVRSKQDTAWDRMSVQRYNDVEQVQQAGPVMQRWIMAHQPTRERYLRNGISGYSGSYENHHGDAVGIDHPDWRHVMSGVGQLVEGSYVMHRFGDLLSEGDVELRPSQKKSILQTWDLLGSHYDNENALEELEDPTCEFGTLM